MGFRWRTFVAMIGVLAFLAAWVWAGVEIGTRLPDNVWIQLVFYAVAGLGWGVPLYPLFKWAEKG